MNARTILATIPFLLLTATGSVQAEVQHIKLNDENFITNVENEPWQPEGFDEALILRASPVEQPPTIDGAADDPAWAQAEPLTVPLSYGSVPEATLKAVYTEKEIFLLVSWPDPTLDDQHHSWVWSPEIGRYVEGDQTEDSLLVSIEAGCEWTPSLLSGYVFDFDGWLWLAARTNPIGQAVDTGGHVQNRWIPDRGFVKYESRNKKPFWNLKFTDHRPEILTKPWYELSRAYLLQPISTEVYVSNQPDGRRPPPFAVSVPPPEVDARHLRTPAALGSKRAHALQPPLPVVPQWKPVKLSGDAGEVAAKGHWESGRWTVEFRRALVTPARTTTDSMFDRVTQFSIHIFDHTERVDEAAESGRLFLQFEPARGVRSK